MRRKLIYLFLTFIILSCNTQYEETITIESFKNLSEIPSASGVEVVNEEIWMVGDDSPYLFRFDFNLNLINKYKISEVDSTVNNRVIKTIKADYESLARKGDHLYILGSGSVVNSRDTLVIFDLQQKQMIRKINMRPVFNLFLKEGLFDSTQQINIEGLIISDEYLMFLNRGNIGDKNDLYSIKHEDFESFFTEGKLPAIKKHKVQLPAIDSFTSGFSGACLSDNSDYLYFTSSVEATNDVYHDGEVLGSFVGRLNLESKKVDYWPITENGEFVKTKLESISIIENTKEFIKFVCTSDNDDGSSGVYHLKLNLK